MSNHGLLDQITAVLNNEDGHEECKILLKKFLILIELVEKYIESREENQVSIHNPEPIECILRILELRKFLDR